jgi:3-phosphoglycerate kinase
MRLRLGLAMPDKEYDLREILEYLKTGGERLDSEIAAATGMSVENVRQRVSKLSATGEVIVCQSIRFDDEGKRSERLLCRIAGYIPPAAPGRKAKVPAKTPA